MDSTLLIAGAGLLAGFMNALAGGGTFVTLPALITAGVPSVIANATSSTALYPAGLAGAWVYRKQMGGVCGLGVRPLLIVSLAGGLVGSLLLLWTPSRVFDSILPWLLLLATVTLAFGRKVGVALQGRVHGNAPIILSVQMALSIYGGYFGGGVGLMMLAAWSLLDGGEIKALTGPRMLMVNAANTVAILMFAIARIIDWRHGLIMMAAALIGGYSGAHLGRRLDPALVRVVTLVVASGMTAAFFWKAYGS